MWGAWLWGFGACLWRELPLTSNPFPWGWAPRWHTSLDFWGRALAARRVTGSQGLVQACQCHSQSTQTLARMINWKILEHIRKKSSSQAQDLCEKGNGDSQHPHTPAHAPRGAFLLEELLNLQSWHAPKVYKSSSWKESLLCWGLLAHLCGPRNRMKGSSWRRRAQSIPNSFFAASWTERFLLGKEKEQGRREMTHLEFLLTCRTWRGWYKIPCALRSSIRSSETAGGPMQLQPATQVGELAR